MKYRRRKIINYKDVLEKLENYYLKLIKAKKYPKGPAWDRNPWDGWEEFDDKIPPITCVYILWNNDECVYVGETENLGARLHGHFYTLVWNSVQFYEFPEHTDDAVHQKNMRLLLERFAIAVLNPSNNIK